MAVAQSGNGLGSIAQRELTLHLENEVLQVIPDDVEIRL